jgi:methylmalonyl-CoA epimerase
MIDARFHHIGILVEDFDQATRVFGEYLGMEVAEPESEPDLGIEILWVTVGGLALELIRPLHADSRAAAALSAGEGGVHHLALEVFDIDRSLAELRAAGVALIDEQPRRGAHGARIAFIEPSAAEGTLIELVQPQAAAKPGYNNYINDSQAIADDSGERRE